MKAKNQHQIQHQNQFQNITRMKLLNLYLIHHNNIYNHTNNINLDQNQHFYKI